MPGKPFLLLTSRSEDLAALEDYTAFQRFTGLPPERLHWIRMEAGPFEVDLNAYAGVLLGGSPFTASVPEQAKSDTQRRVEAQLGVVLAEVLARDVPFLGACYGVGTLVRQAGGVVDGTYAEDTAAVTVTLTDEGRADPLLAGLPAEFTAYVGHKEACTVLPPGAVLLASSVACPVQMLRLGTHQYVTQFHPEVDQAVLTSRVRLYQHAGYFPAAEVEAVLERAVAADVSTAHRLLAAFAERYGG